MRRLLLTLLVAGLCASASAATPLDGLRWSKRVLLVFSPGDAALDAEQDGELAKAGTDALAERDLVVLAVPPRGTARVLFGSGIRAPDAETLRQAYDVATDAPFTTILIGKDGGAKWREARPAGMEELFRVIDAMPMRAEEMRGN